MPHAAPDLSPLPARESAVQGCANSLRAAIVGGRFEAGAHLPPERALAAQLGVNRLTLRAALAQLRGQGLIEVKHGSGTTVRDFASTAGPDLLPSLLELARDPRQRRQVLSELLRLRRAIARAVLEGLTPALTAAGKKRLRLAVDQFTAAVSQPGVTADDVALADQHVVRALLREAGPVMSLCANPVFAVLESLPELRRAMFAEPSANVLAYRAVVGALEAGQPNVAEAANQVLESLDAALLKRISGRPLSPRRSRS